MFASRAAAAVDDFDDALAWVHDYQLLLVPALLRRRLPDQPIGFFLHVPCRSPL